MGSQRVRHDWATFTLMFRLWQERDGLPQGKATGDSFLVDFSKTRNSRTTKGGGRALPRHFSFLKSEDLLHHMYTERLLVGQRRSHANGCSTHMWKNPSWLRDACTHGRILRYTKYELWTRQIKMIGQRKTGRNTPHKWLKLAGGFNSGTLPLKLPMCLFVVVKRKKKRSVCVCFCAFSENEEDKENSEQAWKVLVFFSFFLF